MKIKLFSILLALLLISSVVGKTQTLQPEWIQHYGSPYFETGNYVTMNNGFVYLTGDYTDTADFGDTILTSMGSADAFIAKFDTLGNLIWINTINGNSNEYGIVIDFDQNNNIILAGIFHSDTAYIGDTMFYSCGCSEFTFVAKYNENGDFIWANDIQGDGSVIVRDLKVNANNDVIFIGQFYHSVFIDSDTLYPNGLSDIYMITYSASGNFSEYNIYGGNNIDDAYSLEIDQDGNLYIAGHYSGNVTYGITTLNTIGQNDVFIAKLDQQGNSLWAISAGSEDNDRLFDLVLDDQKNMYLTGYVSDSAIFDTVTLQSAGYLDFFLAKYDSSGNVIWANIYGGIFDDQGNSLNLDANGDIYVTGKFISDMSLDTTVLSSNLYSDLFIAKFNNSGGNIWAKQFQGERNDEGTCIYVYAEDRFFLTGNFRDSVIYDTVQYFSNGNNDILFAKFSKDYVISLPDMVEIDGFEFYPNPVIDVLYVKGNEEGYIRIYDLYGKLILEAEDNEINISFVTPGTYIITLQQDKRVYRKKLIKL